MGDVDFDSAVPIAGYITPVPGGVGPMTVAMLMQNTLRSAERLWTRSRERRVKPLELNILEKVPKCVQPSLLASWCFHLRLGFKSDIEIAQAQTPKRIVDLAAEIGLQPDELESYGRYKAKVELNVLDRLAHRKDGKYIVVSGCVLPRICFRSCYNLVKLNEIPLFLLPLLQDNTNSVRGGQVYHDHRFSTGTWGASWPSRIRMCSSTEPRPHVRH